MKSILSTVTPTMADNPFSIVLLVVRLVGRRELPSATPTAGAGEPTLESVMLHC